MLGKLKSQSKVSPEVCVTDGVSPPTSDDSRSTHPQEDVHGQKIQIYNPLKKPEPGIVFFAVHSFTENICYSSCR